MVSSLPELVVFASGTNEGGGSGFQNLVEASRTGVLQAKVVGVVCNIEDGGVRKRAKDLNVPFHYFPAPWSAERYQEIAATSGADFFALSGWLKLVRGLDLKTRFNPRTVFNIHPGPLYRFGGKGFYGHHVHEAVLAAYRRGEVTCSEVCMHFVTEEYDKGPVFFRIGVKIEENDTPGTLGARANRLERMYQPHVTNGVVSGNIWWDGTNPASLVRQFPL